MRKRRAFTLVELLVVIAIIALLMSILMPALSRVKKQAKAVICMSNLRNWGVCFAMYAGGNDNRFMAGWMQYSTDPDWGLGKQWMSQLRPYYANKHEFALCPMTKKPKVNWRLGGTFNAWANLISGDGAVAEGDYGSYGMNDWAYNPASGVDLYLPENPHGHSQDSWYWRGPGVRNPHNIPLFFDCIWTDAWPEDTDEPPPVEGVMTDSTGEQMQRVCINRHNGYIHCLFIDYSVRRVGLKELWTLKWNPYFQTDNQYTKAGGATPDRWPPWMRKFKDY